MVLCSCHLHDVKPHDLVFDGQGNVLYTYVIPDGTLLYRMGHYYTGWDKGVYMCRTDTLLGGMVAELEITFTWYIYIGAIIYRMGHYYTGWDKGIYTEAVYRALRRRLMYRNTTIQSKSIQYRGLGLGLGLGLGYRVIGL
jgi:hypothetical protein